MSNSKGDPRVLFVMNLVLSAAFASFVVWGMSSLDLMAFTWQNAAAGTLLLMILTTLVIR